MNPIRLVSGAVTLPPTPPQPSRDVRRHRDDRVRTTARVVARVIEQVSGAGPAPSAPWPTDRPVPTEVDPVLGAQRSTTDAPSTARPRL